MKKITEILQDTMFYSLHRINEMSTLSRPADNLPKSAKVCVYGENDEQGTKEPHFHIIIDNGNIELEISLKHVDELNIWRTKRNYPKSWDGLSNVKKAIQIWLNSNNTVDKSKTNKELLVITWNLNNPTNEINLDYIK